MQDCLFCKIVAGEIPSTKIYEDEYVYAFADIDPQAPFHAIIVPKEHITSAADITAENSHLIAKIFENRLQSIFFTERNTREQLCYHSENEYCQERNKNTLDRFLHSKGRN